MKRAYYCEVCDLWFSKEIWSKNHREHSSDLKMAWMTEAELAKSMSKQTANWTRE